MVLKSFLIITTLLEIAYQLKTTEKKENKACENNAETNVSI